MRPKFVVGDDRRGLVAMTEREALLKNVLAAPADDLPRLIYADWCDENGMPYRAKFIREQIASGIQPEAYWRNLCPTGHIGFFNDLYYGIPPGCRPVVTRGFVDGLGLPWLTWAEVGDRILEHHPITRVQFTTPVRVEVERRPDSSFLSLIIGDEYLLRLPDYRSRSHLFLFHVDRNFDSFDSLAQKTFVARDGMLADLWTGIAFEHPPDDQAARG